MVVHDKLGMGRHEAGPGTEDETMSKNVTVWGTMVTGRVVRVLGIDRDPGDRESDRRFDMVVIGLRNGASCRITINDFHRFDLVVEGAEPPVQGRDITLDETQPFACYRDEACEAVLAA